MAPNGAGASAADAEENMLEQASIDIRQYKEGDFISSSLSHGSCLV